MTKDLLLNLAVTGSLEVVFSLTLSVSFVVIWSGVHSDRLSRPGT